MSDYAISVGDYGKKCPIRKREFAFCLLNHGVICGGRLDKGDNEKKANGNWPFKGEDWMFYDSRADAVSAAQKLQKYLETKEPKKTKNKEE